MTSKELLDKIIKETYAIKNALKAKKFDIALSILDDRQLLIDAFVAIEDDQKKQLDDLVEKFKIENDACMEALTALRTFYEEELSSNKVKKQELHFSNKVNQQYKLAETFLIGNRFDSRGKY